MLISNVQTHYLSGGFSPSFSGTKNRRHLGKHNVLNKTKNKQPELYDCKNF